MEQERIAPERAVQTVTLSVVIPTWNRRALTQRAIDSVLAQQGSDELEVIVVDDGSSDGTEAALKLRYGGDARVRVVAGAHRGASAARNVGFGLTRGEYVCFLDSDDFWTAGVLPVVWQIFALYPELAFVSVDGSAMPKPGMPEVARVMRMTAPGWTHVRFERAPLLQQCLRLHDKERETLMLRGDFFPAIVNGDLFSLNGMYLRRATVQGAGPFNERFRWYNDWEFTARVCLQGSGAYLDHEGFRRDVGRSDEISRGHSEADMTRRHLYILHTLPTRFPGSAARHADHLRDALVDAQYQMGKALAHTHRRRWARRYLVRCLRERYKLGRCVALLAFSFLARP